MYRIRAVDGSDPETAEVLRRLHSEVFADTAPQIHPSDGFWWLVDAANGSGGTPVAFCGMEASAAVSEAGYMCRAGVLKGHRGRGLQLRLIRVRERKARALGWSLLRTDTTSNPHSANNLIRAGFRLFEPSIPWAFENSLYWYKSL